MECWRVVSVPVRFYDDLHILIERHEKTQGSFDRELAKLPAHILDMSGWRMPKRSAASTCFKPRSFMIVSILKTSCALIRCSSAFGMPMSLNTFPLLASHLFLVMARCRYRYSDTTISFG